MVDVQLSIAGSDLGLLGAQTSEPWVRPVGWRIAQAVFWLVGLSIFIALLIKPKLGLSLLWNGLIPVAPALVALAPGLWRNICPLASTALFPRHMGWSLGKRLSRPWQGRLMLIGVIILFTLIPMRHVVFNSSGLGSAIVLGALAILAMGCGFIFEWKSAWCSGMCPVHQVEKLYGSGTPFTFTNAHCRRCRTCVVSCPDSIQAPSPIGPITISRPHAIAGTLMLGGFPGFIWGWFHVPSYAPGEGWSHITQAYGYSVIPAGITLAVFLLLCRVVSSRQLLCRVFAASAVSCYYWYRLPWLIGLEPTHPDSALIDLSASLPPYIVPTLRIVMGLSTTTFFMWVLAGRGMIQGRWLKRPPYANATDPSFP